MSHRMNGLELDFPLCASEAANSAARPAVVEAVRLLEEAAGSVEFEAVILTGSFSRGEGSVLLTNPRHRVLGDIEFLVIAKPPFDYPELRRSMRRLGSLATERMRKLGYDVVIEYSPAGRSYLERAIRPSIFAFDLLAHGKTVKGDPAILASVPRFEVSEIPREDAIRLVMNRMMEIHALRLRPAVGPLDEAYLAIKTVLDLAGSYLAFEGRYRSCYRDRCEALEAGLDGAALPASFRGELDKVVRLKLHPTGDEILEQAPSLAWTLDGAMKLWRWEMGRHLGGRDVHEHLEAFLSSEGKWQTLRGWVKYYRHPLRPPGDSIPMWRRLRLFFRASPQRLAYASALLAHHGERHGQTFREEAEALLPSASVGSPLPQAIELWSWLVRNN